MLSCMRDDLLGEFERFHTGKDMWTQLNVRFGQTSGTRLRTLQLKWMQYTIDFSRSIFEHLRAMSAMVRDLKAAGQEVSEEEQVLNVIKALPNDNEYWKSFKVFMTHNEHVKTFEAISKHLEMGEEHLKLYAPPSVAFIAKGLGPKGRKPYHGKKPKKDPGPPQNSHSNGGTAKKHKAKGNRTKDVTRVKCYNCGKKRHFARDCP